MSKLRPYQRCASSDCCIEPPVGRDLRRFIFAEFLRLALHASPHTLKLNLYCILIDIGITGKDCGWSWTLLHVQTDPLASDDLRSPFLMNLLRFSSRVTPYTCEMVIINVYITLG